MKASRLPTAAALLLLLAASPSCGSAEQQSSAPGGEPEGTEAAAAAPAIVQPGAPGQPSRVISVEEATDLSRVQHTDTDVRFMQGMIGHHGQAIDMSALIAERTARQEMRQVGLRITLSQEDEIKMMQEWLAARGEEVPGVHDHQRPGAPLMPGMLTAAEMSRLAAAKQTEFDRLFLEGMIKHHEGALVMVDDLYATPGAGQDSVIAAFTAEVVADQRAEMDRMAVMLNTMR